MEAFAEVIYQDNLYGDRVTVDIGKLLPPTKPTRQRGAFWQEPSRQAFEIANSYAERILNTGEYLQEEKAEISVQSYTLLQGYKVMIEPKAGYVRTYYILVDPTLSYVLFCQSTDKTEEELISLLTQVGAAEGLFNYDEFYNTFYTIPERLVDGDLFLGFTIDKIQPSYAVNKGNANWAKECVGHWSANGYFYHAKKGLWTYGLFDLLTSEAESYMYDMYTRDATEGKSGIQVQGVQGTKVTTTEFDWDTFETYSRVTEINFGTGRYVCMVDNSEGSWLNTHDLVARAEALQLSSGLLNADTLHMIP